MILHSTLSLVCLELAADFARGVPVAKLDEKLDDVAMLAWALAEARVWS